MKLSYKDIEQIAFSSLSEHIGGLTSRMEYIRPVPIESFATHYLGLRIEYTRLSDDERVLGITTYVDTEIKLRRYLRDATINVSANTLLIDERLELHFLKPDTELCRRRFTIARECSHHILHSMESKEKRREMDLRYIGKAFSLRELKTMEDWREWQANAMAAALLMPAKYLALLLGHRRLAIYGNRMNIPDKLALANLSNKLSVSQTAMSFRLKELGYAKVLSKSAYFDPTDIECDDDFHSAPLSAEKLPT
jgi:Zn-dependent peptidase ImmA (M78 family)